LESDFSEGFENEEHFQKVQSDFRERFKSEAYKGFVVQPFAPEKAEALDIDSTNQLNLLAKYFSLRYCFGEVRVKTSPSGEGYHLYVPGGLTYRQAEAFGDCQGRLYYWRKQGYTFTFKKKGEKMEEDFEILSMPFWSRLPPRKGRRQR
jgi:hypothetical protein